MRVCGFVKLYKDKKLMSELLPSAWHSLGPCKWGKGHHSVLFMVE